MLMQPDTYRVRFRGDIGPARNGINLFIRELQSTEALKALLFAILLRVIMPAAASLLYLLNSETLGDFGAWLVQFSRVICNFIIALTVVMFCLEFDPNWDWLINPSSYIRLPDYKYNFDLELFISSKEIQVNLMDYLFEEGLETGYCTNDSAPQFTAQDNDNLYAHYRFALADIQGIQIDEQALQGQRCLTIHGTATTLLPNWHRLKLKSIWANLAGNHVYHFWFPEEHLPDIISALDRIRPQPEPVDVGCADAH